jgi:23S rRNA pseudouridine1911/1915/1917 synthase
MFQDEIADLIIVQEEEAGKRLDKILASRFSDVKSRTYFQFLIDNGHVLVNGVSLKKRYLASVGDEIAIEFILSPEMGLSPEPIPLNIIYEDEDLLVIDKPAGMVVHPAPGNWNRTLANALLYHCKTLPDSQEGTLRPGIVHRLDKDTSGLIVAAKSSLAHQRLIEQFANRQIKKEYLAICLGNPGEREISAPIGRHPVQRKLMTVVEKGREALTFCKTLTYTSTFGYVHLGLATGRTHQIRVHLKHIGCPVLGDAVYGNQQVNQKYIISRQYLHASLLSFIHPIQKKRMEFTVPLAEDMSLFIQRHFKKFPE